MSVTKMTKKRQDVIQLDSIPDVTIESLLYCF